MAVEISADQVRGLSKLRSFLVKHERLWCGTIAHWSEYTSDTLQFSNPDRHGYLGAETSRIKRKRIMILSFLFLFLFFCFVLAASSISSYHRLPILSLVMLTWAHEEMLLSASLLLPTWGGCGTKLLNAVFLFFCREVTVLRIGQFSASGSFWLLCVINSIPFLLKNSLGPGSYVRSLFVSCIQLW